MGVKCSINRIVSLFFSLFFRDAVPPALPFPYISDGKKACPHRHIKIVYHIVPVLRRGVTAFPVKQSNMCKKTRKILLELTINTIFYEMGLFIWFFFV